MALLLRSSRIAAQARHVRGLATKAALVKSLAADQKALADAVLGAAPPHCMPGK